MDSRLLPSGSAEHFSLPSHPSLNGQSASAVGSDGSSVPLDTSGFPYDDKFVSLMDFDPTFLASQTCYSPQESHPTCYDFDITPLLGSSPKQLQSLQFHDEVFYDAFASDTKFSSNYMSSPINGPFLQQQHQRYALVKGEVQQHIPVLSSEFTGLPSLPLLSNPSGGDSLMSACHLYMPSDLECPGNSGSLPSSLSQCQYDAYSFVDNIQLNPSLIGFPSVQILPTLGQDELAFSSNLLRALPPLNVSEMNDCYVGDSTVYTNPFTMQNNFPSNSVQLSPLASHGLQPCSIPLQSAPSRVSSVRSERNVLGQSSTGKVSGESPILDTLALEEYRKAQIGLSNVPSCPDWKGTVLVSHLPDGSANMDPRRKHSKLGNRGRPPARTDEPHLSKILHDEAIAQLLKRKGTRTRKSQSQIEPTSVIGTLVSCRKRRARKSVERKLNEAILIFNNMDSVDSKTTIMEETTAAGFPTDNSREPGASSNFDPRAESENRCIEHNVGSTMISLKFSEYDGKKRDEADIKRGEKASPALELATSVNGNFLKGDFPSYSPSISGVQDESAVECNDNTYSELPLDEAPLTCTSNPDANVVTGIDESRKEEQGSSQQKLSSFYTWDRIAKFHALPGSDHTVEKVTAVESNEEADTEIFEDSRDSLSDAVVTAETTANARGEKAEEICGADVCPEDMNEGHSGTKAEERAKSKSDDVEGNKSSASDSVTTATITTAVVINENAEGNGLAYYWPSGKEPSAHTFPTLLNKCEANNKREDEAVPQKNDDSSSTSDATSKIIVANNPQRDTEDGSCQRHPSSPIPTVSNVDPTAQVKDETRADSSFFEGPSHKLLGFASNEHFEAARGCEGSGEVDHRQHGQQEKPGKSVHIDRSGEFAMGSDPGTEVEPANNCNVEVDAAIECSEAFPSSQVSDSKIQCEISTAIRGETTFSSPFNSCRKADNAFDSVRTDETTIICDKQPTQDIQRVQTLFSSGSVLQERGKSVTLSNVQENVKLCVDDAIKFCTSGMERESSRPAQEANVDFSEKKLAMRVTCSSEPSAGLKSGDDYDRQSDLDVESSIFDHSDLVRNDLDGKGKAPMVHMENHSWKMVPLGQQTNQLEGFWRKESFNSYQGKLMKILTDFIESGYGAGVQPPSDAEVMINDHNEPDIYAELSKGTIVVPSTTPKCSRDKVQRARWRSVSKEGRIRGVTEAGTSSSLHPVSGVCDSDTLLESKTLYRPSPEKVHRTRSRSRSGWGGLRQF